MNDELFGQRLCAERERRRITLESIAANTKIPIALLRDLEADRMARWPGGIFRRAFVRSYALAVGLDPEETLQEFLERYPDTPVVAGDDTAAVPPRRDAPRRRGAAPVLRLMLADEPKLFMAGAVLVSTRRRLMAAACDLGAPVVLAATVYLIAGTFWPALGVTFLAYLAGGLVVLGNTPGVYFFAPGPNWQARPTAQGDGDAGHLAIFEESLIR